MYNAYLKSIRRKENEKIAALLFVILVFICLLTSCNPDAKEVDWNDIVLGSVLPKPQSNLMNIIFNDDADLSVYVFEISQSQYSEYRQWCEQEKGFNIEIETIGDSFYAYNEAGYYLSLHIKKINIYNKLKQPLIF